MTAIKEKAGKNNSGKLSFLLAMAMFVLVVDTSMMNVSISAIVDDIGATVSDIQSVISLEALVSAAFILIGSKIGDLYGRKLAYTLGLIAYAIGAIAMTLAQTMLPIVIFWAIIGGLGASLLLPAMQSLIHGNFEGLAQKKTYALVGASAAIAAAVGPLIGGFITTFLSWRVGFLLEALIIMVVLFNLKLVKDVPYTGSRQFDTVGAILSVVGMSGIVLGILAWESGAAWVGTLIMIGVIGMLTFAWWLVRTKKQGKTTLIDPGLFSLKPFRYGYFRIDAAEYHPRRNDDRTTNFFPNGIRIQCLPDWFGHCTSFSQHVRVRPPCRTQGGESAPQPHHSGWLCFDPGRDNLDHRAHTPGGCW